MTQLSYNDLYFHETTRYTIPHQKLHTHTPEPEVSIDNLSDSEYEPINFQKNLFCFFFFYFTCGFYCSTGNKRENLEHITLWHRSMALVYQIRSLTRVLAWVNVYILENRHVSMLRWLTHQILITFSKQCDSRWRWSISLCMFVSVSVWFFKYIRTSSTLGTWMTKTRIKLRLFIYLLTVLSISFINMCDLKKFAWFFNSHPTRVLTSGDNILIELL